MPDVVLPVLDEAAAIPNVLASIPASFDDPVRAFVRVLRADAGMPCPDTGVVGHRRQRLRRDAPVSGNGGAAG